MWSEFERLRSSRRRRIGAAVFVAILVVVGAALVLGSVGSDNEASSSSAVPVPAAGVPGGPGMDSDAGVPESVNGSAVNGGDAQRSAGSAATAPGSTGAGSARPAGAEPRIVRTGSVLLRVPRGGVDAAISDISSTAKGLGGYLASLESTGTASVSDGDNQYANLTLRMPTGSFDELRERVGKIGEVQRSTVSSRDVTGQYVDLEARLKALQRSRDTYAALLAKAGSIAEILSVQQQIDNVQVQIEQLEGQRQVLADSSDFATLTVQLGEQGTVRTPSGSDSYDGLGGAVRLSWDRFLGGLTEIVALIGPAVLILFLLAAGFAAYRLVLRVRPGGRREPDGPTS